MIGRYDHRASTCPKHENRYAERRLKGQTGAYECVGCLEPPAPMTADQAAREAVQSAVHAKLAEGCAPDCGVCLANKSAPLGAAAASAPLEETPAAAPGAGADSAKEVPRAHDVLTNSAPVVANNRVSNGGDGGGFRVGQRVRCVDARPHQRAQIALGAEYTVMSVVHDSPESELMLREAGALWLASRFKPADEQPASEASDRVLTVRVPAGVRELRIVIGGEE